MGDLKFKTKKVYDFTENYKRSQINIIKRKFAEVCRGDKTLSNDYKQYVSDPKNVNVSLMPVYAFDAQLELYSIHITYEYEETSYYSTGKTGTAELKRDSYGDYHGSVDLHENYESYTSTRNYNAWVNFSDANPSPIFHVGTGIYNQKYNSNYIDVTDNEDITYELAVIAKQRYDYAKIRKYFGTDCIPNSVLERAREKMFEWSKNAKNVRIQKISDYSISEANLYCFPASYKFTVWTTFEGKTYKLTNLEKIEDIESDGPKSDHFRKYESMVSDIKYDYSPKYWPARKIYAVPFILSGLLAITLILLLMFAVPLGLEGLKERYFTPMVAMVIGSLVISVVFCVCTFKSRSIYIPEGLYEPSKNMENLRRDVISECISQKKSATFISSVWSIIMTIVLIAASVCTVSWCNSVNTPHFWYTPEIQQTYVAKSEEGSYSKYTIISCDKEGRVEAIGEFSNGKFYASMTYYGQVTEKKGNSTVIEFTFGEWINNPGVGRPDETITAEFTNGYTQMSDGEDICYATSTDYTTPECLKSYMSHKSQRDLIIEILSCDADGEVKAAYNYITEKGQSEFLFYGNVLYKNENDNELLIVFDKNECLKNDIDKELAEFPYIVNLTDNYTKMTTSGGSDLYTESQVGSTPIIKSASDLLSLSGTSGGFVLQNDIDFQGRTISPITNFSGTLFGNGYTIKNFNISSSGENVGLFKTVEGKIIDLNIENANVSVSGRAERVGILCGTLTGTLSNISVSGKIDAPYASYVGGIAGYANGGGNFEALKNKADVSGSDYVGGVFGYHYVVGDANYSQTENSGTIVGDGNYVSGISGYVKTTYGKINLIDGKNTGNVTGKKYVGGLFGYAIADYYGGSITDSYCKADIEGDAYVGCIAGAIIDTDIKSCGNTGSTIKANLYVVEDGVKCAYVGGFAGYGAGFSDCTNEVAISYSQGGKYVGGIAGYANDGGGNFEALKNKADVSGSDYVGGVFGYHYVVGDANYSQTENSGTIVGDGNYVSGISGYVKTTYGKINLIDGKNTGNVTGKKYVGGLFGYAIADYYGGSIVNSYSTGTVKGTAFCGDVVGDSKNIDFSD